MPYQLMSQTQVWDIFELVVAVPLAVVLLKHLIFINFTEIIHYNFYIFLNIILPSKVRAKNTLKLQIIHPLTNQ